MIPKYFKSNESGTLEYKVFITICLVATLLCAISTVMDFVLPGALKRSDLDTYALVFFGSVYAVTKYKRNQKLFLYPTLAIMFALAPLYWLEVGYINVIGVLVYNGAFAMSILITPRTQQKYILYLYFSLTLLYPAYALTRDILNDTYDFVRTNTYFYFVFITAGVGYAIYFIKHNYEREQESVRGFSSRLKELHQLNLSDWKSLEETFEDYVVRGMNLMNADICMISKKEWNKWRVMEQHGFQSTGEIEEFDAIYRQELGNIRQGQLINQMVHLLGKELGTLMVIPIYADGLFYGHFLFGWTLIGTPVEDYEMEIAEIMAQNLGYMIDSDSKKEEDRRTREALNMSEIRFRRVFENTIAGIAVTDLNGNFIMVNPAFRKMLGYSESELLQMDFSQTGHSDDYDEDSRQFQRLLKGEIEGYQIEKRNVRKDGTILNVSLTVSLIKDTAERARYGIGIIEDITQRKKNEVEIKELNRELEQSIEKLESANRELESFSYSVSHDLRAPLRAINGFSKILVDEYSGQVDAEGQRLINIVAGNALKMSQLIDDLLNFSRLNRQSTKLEKIDLNLLIKEVVDDLQLDYSAAEVVKVDDQLPAVTADKALLRQALINVISNALKFSSSQHQPEVVITGKNEKGKALIDIRDNGVGFEMKYHDKLFKVFQRLHSESEFEGTGVGLAIVDRILTRHGGKIWAESKPGEGATFTMELPA